MQRRPAEQGLGAGDLTVIAAERFAAERRAAGRTRLLSARALIPLLDYLRGLGCVGGEGAGRSVGWAAARKL
jgi:hypothetical protein